MEVMETPEVVEAKATKMVEAKASVEVVEMECLPTKEIRQWGRIANTPTTVATVVGGTTAT